MRLFTNISHRIIDSEMKKADNARINVKLRRVRVTTVAMEKQ